LLSYQDDIEILVGQHELGAQAITHQIGHI